MPKIPVLIKDKSFKDFSTLLLTPVATIITFKVRKLTSTLYNLPPPFHYKILAWFTRDPF